MGIFVLLTYMQCIYNMGEVCCICMQIYYSLYKNLSQYVFGHQPSLGNINVKHVLTKQLRSRSVYPTLFATDALRSFSSCVVAKCNL